MFVPFEPEQVDSVLMDFDDVLARFPYISVIEKRPNGLFVEIDYRRMFSRLRDKLFLTIKKGEGNTLGIAGVGERIELSLTIRAEKGFPNTTVFIDGVIKTDKESLGKKLLEELVKNVETYIKRSISIKLEKAKEEKKEYKQPAIIGDSRKPGFPLIEKKKNLLPLRMYQTE